MMYNESIKESAKIASFWDIYILGISIVIGGQAISWNVGLEANFNEFLIATIIVSIGYFLLVLCISEMISSLPFSGGLYALSRVALNPYLGFLMGYFEVIHNVLIMSSAIIPLGWVGTQTFQTPYCYEPMYWIGILVFVFSINAFGGKVFWTTNRILGIMSILILILYFFTPISNSIDYFQNTQPTSTIATTTNNTTISSTTSVHHSFDIKKMFQYMPLGIWWYVGIELVPFACIDTPNPAKSIPIAMIGSILTLISLTMFIYFIACAQAPGITELKGKLLPLSYGFGQMFRISERMANFISIPCLIVPIIGFIFGGSRQLWALSSSGLLPAVLMKRNQDTNAPYAALIAEEMLILLAMIIIRYGFQDNSMILFYLYILASASVHIIAFVTYIAFKHKYPALRREFVNPLGVYGAYVGLIIFLIIVASILGLQHTKEAIIAPISIGIFVFLGTCYYFCYANKRQFYSEDEQKAFFITYIINASLQNSKNRLAKSNSTNLHQQSPDKRKLPNFLSFRSLFSRSKQQSQAQTVAHSTEPSFKTLVSDGEHPHSAHPSHHIRHPKEPVITFQQLPSLDTLNNIQNNYELSRPIIELDEEANDLNSLASQASQSCQPPSVIPSTPLYILTLGHSTRFNNQIVPINNDNDTNNNDDYNEKYSTTDVPVLYSEC